MNVSTLGWKPQYQAALVNFLRDIHQSQTAIVTLLCHQARQAGFQATDWLKLHQQAMDALAQTEGLTVEAHQQAQQFLYQCLQSWERSAPFSTELLQLLPAHIQTFVLNQIQSAVIVTNLSGEIIYWNAYAETLYQLDPQDYQASIFAILVVPQKALKRLMMTLKRQAFWEGGLTVQRRDGFVLTAHVVAKPIETLDRQLCGFVCVSRNINGHHQIQHQLKRRNDQLDQSLRQKAKALLQANEQLRQEIRHRKYIEGILRRNEERFHKLSANIPGLLFQWIRQPDGQVFVPYVSARCYDILKIEPGELYYFWPFLDGIPQADASRLRQAMEQSAKDLSPLTWEGLFRTPCGQQKCLQMACQPSRVGDEDILWDGVLFDITERWQAKLLQEQQAQQYQNLVSNVPGVIYRCVAESHWPLHFISEEITAITGYPVEHFLQEGIRSLDDLTYPDDQLMLQMAIDSAIKVHKPYQIEYRIMTAQGDLRWVLERGQSSWDKATQQSYLDGVIIDINDLKVAESYIQASLAEKEVLLKEVHHRVKNNLNLVYSMLEMQGRQSGNVALKEILMDSQQRLQVMALIHEHLYRSEQLSKIDFADYLEVLAQNYISMAYADLERIPLTLEVEKIFVSLETAIPAGLIINELLTNALKHAFPERSQGTVQVIFKRQANGLLYLAVYDDGVGLPTSFQSLCQSSLGMRLVNILADQLDAELRVVSQPCQGTQFSLTFDAQVDSAVRCP